jgi:hypothetical protein
MKWLINTEAWHCSRMDVLAKHAMRQKGGKTETAVILKHMDNELTATDNEKGPIYECIHNFFLPSGSTNVVLHMARFCLMPPMVVGGIVGFVPMDSLPYETFSLYSLLLAAYPRDTRTNIFHGTMGNFFAEGLFLNQDEEVDDDMVKQIDVHRTFSGLGVVFLKETRMALDQLMDDDQTIMRAHKHELMLSFVRG